MSDIGDNSIAAGQLRSIVERVERLHEERKALADDISDIYQEAKGNGLDPKIIRKVVQIRSQDSAKRIEEQTILGLYLASLGQADLA